MSARLLSQWVAILVPSTIWCMWIPASFQNAALVGVMGWLMGGLWLYCCQQDAAQ